MSRNTYSQNQIGQENKIPANQHTDAPKTCFSYVRFSSRVQAKGDSERRQLEIAPRIAKEKGWHLREDLCAKSLGLSAYKGSNLEKIEGIIKAAQDGKIPKGSVMILEALDRLTRIPLDDAYQLFRRLLMAGIEIYTDRTGRQMTLDDLNNPMSLMMTVVELDAAFQYSDKLSDRVGKAWKRKKAQASDGVIFSNSAPAWLDVDRKNNKFTPNEKAKVVERIYESYASGKGIRTIMHELNAEKVAPFGKGRQNESGCWSSTHIRRLLSYRGVLGEYQPCRYVDKKRMPEGTPIEGYYPAVIDKALFYKVEQKLSKTDFNPKTGKERSGHSSGPKRNVTNLFTGLVKCAVCGGSMVIKQSGKHRGKYDYTSLVCYNATRGTGCKYHTIQYEFVERAVLTLLFSKVVPTMAETDSKKGKIVGLQGELLQTQKLKNKWIDVIEQSEKAPELAGMKLNALETKEAVLKKQIESLSATADDNPLVSWKHLPKTPENRLLLQSILADEIKSLTIDASKQIATLNLSEPECSFNLSWPSSIGSNKTKKNPARLYFNCEGEGLNDKFEYLDNMFVWKSEENIDIRIEEVSNYSERNVMEEVQATTS